ncbi:MAG: hypothetical protein J1E96_07405 [Ruminococcus sp.]|nr:hypothetical protein [Ruminococcus sp.]
MDIVSRVLNKYGSKVKVTQNGTTIETKAFIQPLSYDRKSYFDSMRLPEGSFDNNHFLMLAHPSLVLSKSFDIVIESADGKYSVKSSGNFRASDKVMYVWAVLTACTGTTEDDYD